MSGRTVQFTRPFINGQFVPTSHAHLKHLIEPWTGNPWTQVQEASVEQVSAAIQAAKDAFEQGPWSSWTGPQRRDALFKLALKIEEHQETLSWLESTTGKPIRQARGDIQATIECFKHFAGHADKMQSRVLSVDPKYRTLTLREPLGVCGLIRTVLAAWKLAPALAAGNTVILKPAPQTPLSSLYFGHLAMDLFPKGVINILPGGTSIGEAIVQDPRIRKISFTGSTQIGRVIASSCSQIPRPVTLELGGKAPMIVCEDADLDLAIEGVVDAAFANGGQNCCAGTRLYLHKTIHDKFLGKLRERVAQIKMGSPIDLNTDLGPLVDERQWSKVQGFIERATKNGFKSFDNSLQSMTEGHFVPATVFYNVPDDAEIATQEIFGPILCVLNPFENVDEAIKRANDTPFGLGAGIWTSTLQTAEKAMNKIKAGMIWVNCYNDNPAYLPFGGYKESGYGKDLGEEALSEFTIVKSVQSALM